MPAATLAGRPSRMAIRIAALILTCVAFWVYRSTMLPGLDLGDTPSFQTMGGSPLVSPRDGYPLYFALAAPLVWWFPDNPAHALNLASVAEGSLACGLTVLVAAELSGSLAAAVVAAIVFGSSYTFWSQSVTAEVYALHIMCVAFVLLTLWGWQRKPTLARLAGFFLTYAVGFGNHLSMVLLLPGLVVFLLITAPEGARTLLRQRVMVIAVLCAAIGALPYLWTIRTMLAEPVPPHSVREAVQWFWFEVTKADWRDTMVLQVPRVMAPERLRMFAFDVQQQFSGLSLLLAMTGAAVLLRTAPSRLCLLAAWMISTALFALTYSVGDTHVFLLPLHFVIALLVAPGLAGVVSAVSRFAGTRAGQLTVASTLLLAMWRTHSEYPALDRSNDRRGEQALADLTTGLEDGRAILLATLNWQLQNALNYYAAHPRRDIAFTRTGDVLPYALELIRDNRAIGRETVATDLSRTELAWSYGPLLTFAPQAVPATASTRIGQTSAGTRYVLCWLKPTPETPYDPTEIDDAVARLTGGRVTTLPPGNFVVLAGRAGGPPDFVRESNRPFREEVAIGELPVTIRFEAWFPFDTIRRMGFGHVIANRHHSLIVERGLSFVTLDDDGRATRTEYAAGLFAPQATFRVTEP
jgi:hypothetical protein